MPDTTAAANPAEALVAALDNPLAFGHPLRYRRVLETHISWIILTGDYAYKIKKPVAFGFLDFSTLAKRRFYCAEELRLNRRFAPELYLDLVAIRGSIEHPRMHGRGAPIEYAVKMLEFSQQDLLSAYAADGRLDAALVDAMAATISEIHARCPRAPAASDFGSARTVMHWSQENLAQLSSSIPAQYLPPGIEQLRDWYREQDAIDERIELRRRQGFVRECHGDLHLGNMAWRNRRVTLFDCIEFNPQLRWIDIISEAAFVAMDLQARGFTELGWRFINGYLQASGDYAGVDLLGYYLVYRALVRAKVEALRADEDPARPGNRFEPALAYIELASHWAEDRRPALILMHGLSGSGKSTIAARLAETLGAIWIRSDIERKRLHGLAANACSGSALDGGIYSVEASATTYARLAELAQISIDAGWCVIVDAAFLHARERARLLDLESASDPAKIILRCDAPVDELRRRIRSRVNDPSEASLEVLERQLETVEPITAREQSRAVLVHIGEAGLEAKKIAEIGSLLPS